MTFIVIQKNATSLCSSDRVEELAREKCDGRWDALLISESMETRKSRAMDDTPRQYIHGSWEIHKQTRS